MVYLAPFIAIFLAVPAVTASSFDDMFKKLAENIKRPLPAPPLPEKPPTINVSGDVFEKANVEGINTHGDAIFQKDLLLVSSQLLCNGISHGEPATKQADFTRPKGDKEYPDGFNLGLVWVDAGSSKDMLWPKVDGGWKATIQQGMSFNGTYAEDWWSFFIQDAELNTHHCSNAFGEMITQLDSTDRSKTGEGVVFKRKNGQDDVGRYELFALKTIVRG